MSKDERSPNFLDYILHYRIRSDKLKMVSFCYAYVENGPLSAEKMGSYKLVIMAKNYHFIGRILSFRKERDELTFRWAVCYNVIHNDTGVSWQLTGREARRGANFIVFMPTVWAAL